MRKRIVTTRCNSDFDELITPEYGQIIPIDNKEKLVQAIEKEISNRKVVDKIPEMLTRFSIKVIAKNYLKN